jgi:hypothetical protein
MLLVVILGAGSRSINTFPATRGKSSFPFPPYWFLDVSISHASSLASHRPASSARLPASKSASWVASSLPDPTKHVRGRGAGAGAGTSRCHPSEVNQPHLRHPLTTTHYRTTHLPQNHVNTHRCLMPTLDALHLYFSRSHCAGPESTPVLISPPLSNRPHLPPLICASPRPTPNVTRLREL